MNGRFWNGRTVLITGHTGFKGSWLSLWLQRAGAHVVGYALAPPTEPSLFVAAGVGAGMTSVTGDVRDHEHLHRTLDAHRPDVVIHLAAQSVVRRSYDAPLETYSTNVMGTVALLDALRRVPGRCAIVNVTTDKVYRNNEWVWGYRENDPLGGHDPYSNSKACAELVTQSFVDAFFSPGAGREDAEKIIATARAGNVIGGGDWTPHQLIPDVMQAFHERRPVELRSPQSVRPWQFVLDCLDGYLLLAEQLCTHGRTYAGAWNFGPVGETAVTVRQIVERLRAAWPGSAEWRIDDGPHPHEARTLQLDPAKAVHELGWAPRLPLDAALDWIAQWYVRYFDGISARALCDEQIDRYQALDDAGPVHTGRVAGTVRAAPC